jgi:hypothetical protein
VYQWCNRLERYREMVVFEGCKEMVV